MTSPFRSGSTSGEVMATSVGRSGDFTVIGDSVNVAARLETVASAGEVLCGKLTVDLASRGVVFRERGSVLLKGKREPVQVWEAADLRRDVDGSSDREAPQSREPPLIGRADELAFLESQWRRVCRDRRAQVVLLCGDAGAGKTRLLVGARPTGPERRHRCAHGVSRVRVDGWATCGGRGHPPARPDRRRRGECPPPVGRRRDRPLSPVRRPGSDEARAALGLPPSAPREVVGEPSARRDRRHAPQRRPDPRSLERARRSPRRRPAHDTARGAHRTGRLALEVPDRNARFPSAP